MKDAFGQSSSRCAVSAAGRTGVLGRLRGRAVDHLDRDVAGQEQAPGRAGRCAADGELALVLALAETGDVDPVADALLADRSVLEVRDVDQVAVQRGGLAFGLGDSREDPRVLAERVGLDAV